MERSGCNGEGGASGGGEGGRGTGGYTDLSIAWHAGAGAGAQEQVAYDGHH